MTALFVVATLCDAPDAAVDPSPCASATAENVSGSPRVVQLPIGQTMARARPTTESSETVPW